MASRAAETLVAARLMRSAEEVAQFETALAELAQSPTSAAELDSILAALDDATDHPEVMFGLVHFIESFPLDRQNAAVAALDAQVASGAASWLSLLRQRACRI